MGRRITVEAEVFLDDEVLQEFTVDELLEEINTRKTINESVPIGALLDRIFYTFRDRGDAPTCLRDYLYEMTGKILP